MHDLLVSSFRGTVTQDPRQIRGEGAERGAAGREEGEDRN